jgi:hypothetical protein
MDWKKPEFEDINMNAEIGSYQEDEGGRFPVGAGHPRMEPVSADPASPPQEPASA